MILTLFMYVLEFDFWSICVSLDLCPLEWMLGVSYEAADPETFTPHHTIKIAVPTLRFEVSWAQNKVLEETDAILEKLEGAQ